MKSIFGYPRILFYFLNKIIFKSCKMYYNVYGYGEDYENVENQDDLLSVWWDLFEEM